jgi:hypothetical protein
VRISIAAIALCAGCWTTASSDPGLGDAIYVDGAQFRPGPFPDATAGPPIAKLDTAHTTLILDEHRERLHGVLDPAAQSAIVGIVGARGAWIVPAGPPDFDTPGFASLHAVFGVTSVLGPGPFTLSAAAVDAQGRIGDAMTIDLVASAAAPPDGDLVVMLEWSGSADLDLHVVDPTGAEAWVGHPNTWQVPPPGTPGVDPCAWASGGILDVDANASCTRSGLAREDVIWTSRTCNGTRTISPIIPPGTYTVRVDARSLCGDASEPWAVSVYGHGALIGAARGIATPDDVAYQPHGNLAGITALTFAL